MSERNKGPLKFLSDKPTHDDALGIHKAIASNIGRIVMSELPKPFVIGLFGSWGSGKSSVVEMLGESPQKPFRIVVIDAWRLDKSNFLREFVKRFASGLLHADEAKKVQDKVNSKKSEQSSTWKPDVLGWVFFFIYLIAAIAVFVAVVKGRLMKELATGIIAVLTTCAVQLLLPRFSRKVDTRTEEISIDDPVWFRQIYFNDILQKASGQTVLAVVDNLDRVSGEDALAIIKFLKTFVVDAEDEGFAANKSKVAFLIPCDDVALKERIDKQDSKPAVGVLDSGSTLYSPIRSNKSNEFLSKFVNISLRIPPLLDQDNTKYIRALVVETGIEADANVIDDMAFMVARASSDNPRKPKTILNHFVARYNLALTFEGCAKIVKEHPDWFLAYSIFESEFGGFHVRDFLEPSQYLRESLASSPGDTFRNAIAPIIGSVTNEAWRAFQFLKKPNVHDAIPSFRDLVQSGLNRDAEQFTKQLLETHKDHPNVLNYLWNERGDQPSRSAFAECILKAYETNSDLRIPQVILSDIRMLIQSSTKGWMHFPFEPTWELVLKGWKECILSALRSFNSGDYDVSPQPRLFLRGLVMRALEESNHAPDIRSAIPSLLDLHSAKDVQLVVSAIQHPTVVTPKAFAALLEGAVEANPIVEGDVVMAFLKNASKVEEFPIKEFLDSCRNKISGALGKFSTLNEKQQICVAQLCGKFVRGMLNSEFGAQITHEDKLLRTLVDQLERLRSNAKWEVYACIMEQCAMLSVSVVGSPLREFALSICRNRLPGFLTEAPINIVDSFINANSEHFRKDGIQNVHQISIRSPQLSRTIFIKFQNLRPDVISVLASKKPEWVSEIVSEVNKLEDKALCSEIGILITKYASGRNSHTLLSALGQLKCDAPEFQKAIGAYFDRRCATKDLSKTGLISIFQDMKTSDYQMTESQRSTLKQLSDMLPILDLDENERSIIQQAFGRRTPSPGAV